MAITSETATSATVEEIHIFMDPSKKEMDDKLYCILSGAAVSFNIESDMINAELSGIAAKETFISDKLQKKEQFFEPIKRLN